MDTGRPSNGSTQQRSSREMRNTSTGSRRSMNDSQARPAAQAAMKPTLRMVRQDTDDALAPHNSLVGDPASMNSSSQRRGSEDFVDRDVVAARSASNETAPVIPPITAGRDFSDSIADRSIGYPANVEPQSQTRYPQSFSRESQAAQTSLPDSLLRDQLRSNDGRINHQVPTSPITSRDHQQPHFEQGTSQGQRTTTSTARKPLPVPPLEDTALRGSKRAPTKPQASAPSPVARTERFEESAPSSYVPVGQQQRHNDQQYLVKDAARPASLRGVVDLRNTVDTTVTEVVAPGKPRSRISITCKY